jgi:hypothetical protein
VQTRVATAADTGQPVVAAAADTGQPVVAVAADTGVQSRASDLYAKIKKAIDEKPGTVDNTKIVFYTTTTRGGPIDKISNKREDFSETDTCFMMDPNRIDAIRFGYDLNDGNKGIFEGRFASEKHNRDGGWYPMDDIESLDIDRQLIDRAKRKPMTTVELADGSREINMDSSSDCGLAHSSVERPIVFRAKSNSQSCVLAAYGNAISMSIDPERKSQNAYQRVLQNCDDSWREWQVYGRCRWSLRGQS